MMLTSLLRDILMLLTTISDMKICAISPISGGNDSRKRHEKRLIFKIGTIHPHGLNERFSFIWSHLFIVSVFVQQGWTKALTSHLFTPPFHSHLFTFSLFMFIHLPLIYFATPPRLLIDFKNSKWLTYLCILLCICYCFSHLIGLRSVTWLSLLYKFTRFSIYFLFPSDEGPMLETLDYTIRIGSTPTFLYFDLYIIIKCLINLVCSVCTGKHLPSVFFRTDFASSCRSVCTKTSDKYFRVQTSHSVNNSSIFKIRLTLNLSVNSELYFRCSCDLCVTEK